MATVINMTNVPQIRDLENEQEHAVRVKTLAAAMCRELYVTEWSRDQDGFFVPPTGIQEAINTVYEQLSNHRLIGKYVIPDQVNNKWLGIHTDHIFSTHQNAVNTGTSKSISWEDAVMAASVFLRQKYLEIIGDISLWKMNASTDSPGLRNLPAAYNSALPEKQGLSADGEETVDADDVPRTYFLQNRRDYRLLLPTSVRALVQGNVDLKKAQPLRSEMTTTAFSGLSKMDTIAVALGGIQYRTIYVDGAPHRNHSTDVELGDDGKPTSPPDYTTAIEMTPLTVEVKPIIGLMVIRQCNDDSITMAETGGITFVKQPNVTGSSAEQDVPYAPSDKFFHGVHAVEPVDAVNLLLAVRMAVVFTFGEIRERIANLKYSLPQYKVNKMPTKDILVRDQQAAYVVNGRNVPFQYLYPEPSFTMFKSQYGTEGMKEAGIQHYSFTKMVLNYSCTHDSRTSPLRLKVMHDVKRLSEEERERRQQRYHKSCGDRWDDCGYCVSSAIGATCTLVCCGKLKWDDDDCCKPPKNGLCGLLFCCCIWRPIWCIRHGRCDCSESSNSSCC